MQLKIVAGPSRVPLDDILYNPANWRIHPREQYEAFLASVRALGWLRNAIVNVRTGHLVDGHLRCLVADAEGQADVGVTWVDLSEAEELHALATFDPLGDLAIGERDKLDAMRRADPLFQSGGLGGLLDRMLPSRSVESGAPAPPPLTLPDPAAAGRYTDQVILRLILPYSAAEAPAIFDLLDAHQARLGVRTYTDVVLSLLRTHFGGPDAQPE